MLRFRSHKFFQNDSLGCISVSWAPYNQVLSTSASGATIYRLVTGSCDNYVRVWKWIEGSADNAWSEEAKTVNTPHKGKLDLFDQVTLIMLAIRLGSRCCLGSKLCHPFCNICQLLRGSNGLYLASERAYFRSMGTDTLESLRSSCMAFELVCHGYSSCGFHR